MKQLLIFPILSLSILVAITPSPQATHATAELPPAVGLEAAYSQTIGDDDVQYHSVRHADGYQADNPAQGYTTTFDAEGVTVSTEAWSWSMQLQGYDTTLPIAETNTTTYERDGLTEWYINGPVGLEQGFTLHEPAGRIATLELALLGDLTPTLVDEQTMILQTASGVTTLRYHGLVAYDATHRQLPAWLALGGVLRIHVDTSGAVYPVTIDPWVETQKLTASDAVDFDRFGFSVAIDGTTAIVGAPQNALDGAAYIFTESGGVWTEQAKLVASDSSPNNLFGISVAIDGTTAIIGAFDGGALNGSRGVVYVFTESGGVWTEQTKLIASDAHVGDNFGLSGAIRGATVIIGAPGQSNGGGVHQGAIYVFTESGGVWTQQAKFTLSDAQDNDQFGYPVAIDGTTAVVGAFAEGRAGGDSHGAAYIFTENSGVWSQQARLAAPTPMDLDWFGGAVAIDGTTVIVSAPGEDGVAENSGAVYVFTGSGATWTQEARLTASDAQFFDHFGAEVAIDGTTVIIGANVRNSSQGAAYVFTKSASVWMQQAILTASDAENADSLGDSVAIDGATVIVGAPGEDGIGTDRGAVYVFLWSQPPTPEPPPPGPPPTVIDPALSKIGVLQPGQLGLPGEQITWTITATAPSNADLNNVVISDTFRDELQIDGVTTTAGTVIINGQTVTVTIPVMAAGSSVTIQVTTTVLSSPVDGIFENTVTLTADGGVFLTTTATVSVVTGLPDTGYPPGEALHTE